MFAAHAGVEAFEAFVWKGLPKTSNQNKSPKYNNSCTGQFMNAALLSIIPESFRSI